MSLDFASSDEEKSVPPPPPEKKPRLTKKGTVDRRSISSKTNVTKARLQVAKYIAASRRQQQILKNDSDDDDVMPQGRVMGMIDIPVRKSEPKLETAPPPPTPDDQPDWKWMKCQLEKLTALPPPTPVSALNVPETTIVKQGNGSVETAHPPPTTVNNKKETQKRDGYIAYSNRLRRATFHRY